MGELKSRVGCLVVLCLSVATWVGAGALGTARAEGATSNAQVHAATVRQHLEALRQRYPENQAKGLAFRHEFKLLYHQYLRDHRWVFKDSQWPLFLERRVLAVQRRKTAALQRRQAMARALAGLQTGRERGEADSYLPLASGSGSALQSAGGVQGARSLNGASGLGQSSLSLRRR